MLVNPQVHTVEGEELKTMVFLLLLLIIYYTLGIFCGDCTYLIGVKHVTPQTLNAIGSYLSSGDKIRIKNEANTRRGTVKKAIRRKLGTLCKQVTHQTAFTMVCVGS